MLKQKITSFILGVLLFTSIACNKEIDCDTVITHYVSDDTKRNAIAPLTGTDTLKFLYNNTDTQIYVGQGLKSDWIYEIMRTPGECDQKYEYLIYNYNCINDTGFSFRMQCYILGNSDVPFKFFFKNISVGNYFISSKENDSISLNNTWFYSPYFWTNDSDTMQYVMFGDVKKNPTVSIIKIKFPNTELTLLK